MSGMDADAMSGAVAAVAGAASERFPPEFVVAGCND